MYGNLLEYEIITAAISKGHGENYFLLGNFILFLL